MTSGSISGFFRKHILHRMRLKWYRVTRPDVVTKGNPFRQIWVDADAITTSLQPGSLNQEDHFAPIRNGIFCKYSAVGLVEDGDWDTKVKGRGQRKGLLFHALEDRYFERTAWEDTEFFSWVVEQTGKGLRPWNGCRNHNDILRRCARADRLIQSIKRHGFRENADPVVVCIGADGSLIKAGNGQHRIMLGLITGRKIPVLPIVRHKKWEDLRRGEAKLRTMHFEHPDLAKSTAMSHLPD